MVVSFGQPLFDVATNFTWYVPAVTYICTGFWVLLCGVPSPKSQSQPVMLFPLPIIVPSVKEVRLFKHTELAVKFGCGAGFTTICKVVTAVQPLLVVTVSWVV